MDRSQISAVVVTKGDRDISRVVESLAPFGQVIVHDNSKQVTDSIVFGRWIAAASAKHEAVFVCDDDTIVDSEALCAQFRPGRILCNMPERWHKSYLGTGICLVGFGAVFERSMVWPGFAAYDAAGHPRDEVFLREADRVWTYELNGLIDWADVPIKQMGYSCDPGRMYRERRTNSDYAEIRRRIGSL